MKAERTAHWTLSLSVGNDGPYTHDLGLDPELVRLLKPPPWTEWLSATSACAAAHIDDLRQDLYREALPYAGAAVLEAAL